MRVFVSYARTHFYLAEDLALALGERGVEAWFDVHRLRPGEDWNRGIREALRSSAGVLLIASPAALASPHVQAELEFARLFGKQVIVGIAERVELPPSLVGRPSVDLRGDFERNADHLVAMLRGHGGAPDAVSRTRWTPRQPLRVRLVSGLLLTGALGWAASVVPQGLALHDAMGVLGVGTYVVVWWAFSHRRRGSTMPAVLAVALMAFVGLVAGVAVLIVGAGTDEKLAGAAFLLVGCVALGTVGWAGRSSSLYRWLPTGDATRALRRRMLERRGCGSARTRIRAVTFDVHCHEVDSIVGRELEQAMDAMGHRRMEGQHAEHQILVISDLTPRDWLSTMLEQVRIRVIVIAAPVAVTFLAHFERYHWVDHRRRLRRTLAHLASSLGRDPAASSAGQPVPESLSKPVLPVAVQLLSAGCVVAAAGIWSAGIAGLAGLQLEVVDEPRTQLWSFGALGLGGALAYVGATLATRRITLPAFVAVSAVLLLTHRATQTDDPVTLTTVLVDLGALLVLWRIFRRWLPARRQLAVPTLGSTDASPWRRPKGQALILLCATIAFLGIDSTTASGEAAQPAVNPRMSWAVSSGTSSCGQCPMPSSSTQSACGSQAR